ncbi:hypothetical protein [Actinobacillus porcinus]|uniref:hypothetical protein n=1 Tax=Actinobacillus porcinus TaxID=51048 RepID=UPI002353C063|nr:hypothetical protein [Actinobacillus porcinus]
MKFLAKFVLFERSEFTNLALKKFQKSEEKQQIPGVLSFAYFALHKQRQNL